MLFVVCDVISGMIYDGRSVGFEGSMEVLEMFGWWNFWMNRRYVGNRLERNVCFFIVFIVVEFSERSGWGGFGVLFDNILRGFEVSGFRDRRIYD